MSSTYGAFAWMMENQESFPEWYNNEATDDDRKLCDLASTFDGLFDDFRFAPGTSTYNLLKIKAKKPGEDEWIDDEYQLPEEIEWISSSSYRWKVEPSDEFSGRTSPDLHLITVTPENASDEITIIHEMIHLYEETINDHPEKIYHDMIMWALYKDLQGKVPHLDRIISYMALAFIQDQVARRGGAHDILFLLKSLDLDLRMGYRLGTLFSYGRTDDISEIAEGRA